MPTSEEAMQEVEPRRGAPALPIAVLGELSLGRAKRVLGDKRRHRDRDPLARRPESRSGLARPLPPVEVGVADVETAGE